MPDPAGLPPAGVAHLQALKTAAGRVAASTNLPAAATDTAAMLATCGDCHRAVGTMPAHPSPAEPKIGGVIGHMEQHRNASDLLAQGLTTPSTSLWNDGADVLLTAPLSSDQMPPKATITRDAMKREKDIHALATRARQATDRDARVAIYGELIASCSACHAGNKNGYAR
jgi:cytochrome c553